MNTCTETTTETGFAFEESVAMMMPDDAVEHLVMLDTCGKRPLTAMEAILVGHLQHALDMLASQ